MIPETLRLIRSKRHHAKTNISVAELVEGDDWLYAITYLTSLYLLNYLSTGVSA